MIEPSALTALKHFFGNAANHEAGACVVNALLTQIEAAGRRPRLTRDDFARLSDLFELLHIPGPLDAPQSGEMVVKPDVVASLQDIAERTRLKAANGPRNDPNNLPEASMLKVTSGPNSPTR